MNKNFVLAVLFSGMMFVGSTCVYADTTTGNEQKIEKKDNSGAEKKDVKSVLSLETIWNSIKARTSDMATHISTHKYKYGVGVSLLIAAALIYKTYIAQNDDEEEAPTTIRNAKYNATR